MARLRELVRQGRMVSRKDQKHLAERDEELDLAEVIEAGDVTLDVVTVHSIGTALLGFRSGDVFDWRTPGGTRRLQIEEVLFQPEAAGVGSLR